jgi:hypothetical protein
MGQDRAGGEQVSQLRDGKAGGRKPPRTPCARDTSLRAEGRVPSVGTLGRTHIRPAIPDRQPAAEQFLQREGTGMTTVSTVGDVAPITKPVCQHCGRQASGCAGGLCLECHADKKVRAMYRRRTGVRVRFARVHSLPAEPTAARPGSEEKLRILAARADRREQLFHPQDRQAWRRG